MMSTSRIVAFSGLDAAMVGLLTRLAWRPRFQALALAIWRRLWAAATDKTAHMRGARISAGAIVWSSSSRTARSSGGRALTLRPGAQRIAEGFANAGGEKTAANAFEELMGVSAPHPALACTPAEQAGIEYVSATGEAQRDAVCGLAFGALPPRRRHPSRHEPAGTAG